MDPHTATPTWGFRSNRVDERRITGSTMRQRIAVVEASASVDITTSFG